MKPANKITFQENFYKAMPKVIYLFWDQGWDQAPELVQRCARSWERWNPDYIVHRLTRHDLREQFPEFFSILGRLRSLLLLRRITNQAFSDLLRIRLLDRHGGIWADSTTLCRKPLRDWLPEQMPNGFFAFHNEVDGRILPSWFLASTPGHQLTARVHSASMEYWRLRRKADNYYWFHHIIVDQHKNDPEMRALIEGIPYFDANHLRSAGPHKLYPYESIALSPLTTKIQQELDSDSCPLFKLSWRIKSKSDSVLEYVLRKYADPPPFQLKVPQLGNITMPKRYLVITTVGTHDSAHKQWIDPGRNFDLFLVNYGDIPGLFREDADRYFEIPGFKLQILAQAIRECLDEVRQYSAVWLPDDDLDNISMTQVMRLFYLFEDHALDLAQPAVANEYFNHIVTRRQPGCQMRFVNFVEMMCPMFRTEVLLDILHLFSHNQSGMGIDYLWSQKTLKRKVPGDPQYHKNIAIIDEISVVHRKKTSQTGPYYKKLAAMGIDPHQENEQLLADHNLSHVRRYYETYSTIYNHPLLNQLLNYKEHRGGR